MATVQRFEDLEIWQSAKVLYSEMNIVCERLKAAKEFRFAEQMRSAAGSIMDNIAEGFERNSRLEFINTLMKRNFLIYTNWQTSKPEKQPAL